MAMSNLRERIVMLGGAVVALGALVVGIWIYASLVTPSAYGERTDVGISEVALGTRRISSLSKLPSAVRADFWLIGGYGVFLLIGTALACWLLRDTLRAVAAFGVFTAVVTVVADCAENAFLLIGVHTGGGWFRPDQVASTAATLKISASLPAAAVAVTGVLLALKRGALPAGITMTAPDDVHAGGAPDAPADQDSPSSAPAGPPAPPRPPAPPTLCDAWRRFVSAVRACVRFLTCETKPVTSPDNAASPLTMWERGYAVPDCEHAQASSNAPAGEQLGLALSGGGIRSACTALGALQSVRFRDDVVRRAKLLVSVSGGGYTAEAFTQFLTAAGTQAPADQAERGRNAFLIGSPEADHVRRHSSYLADTPGLMIAALASVLIHMLLTLTLLFGAAVLAGVGLGFYLSRFPVADLDQRVWQAVEVHVDSIPFPEVRDGTYWAVGSLIVLTLLAWLVSQYRAAYHPNPDLSRRPWWVVIRRALLVLTLVVAFLTVGLPALIWLSAFVLNHTTGGLHTVTPVLSVLFAYGASVSAVLRRSQQPRAGIGKIPKGLPPGFVQIILVIGANVVIAAAWLVLLGAMATVGLHPLDGPTRWALAGLAVVVVLLGGFVDETTLSLHPFYRARLAGAFAVRRVEANGVAQAEPYDSRERTNLATYGAFPAHTEFPHVIFAASATLGAHQAPPGLNRVSYTFCSDWIGGPALGWVRTDAAITAAPNRIRRDLTVQGAVALSGAAFAASAGGQGAKWYESLFVLTGARLGSWMPNPRYMIEKQQTAGSPAAPNRLPTKRRVTYLLREMIGVHSPDDPLLQITDGGFYDNLGLIELFRRKCMTIVCIDASGDTPPFAATLARTLLVARRELGVETTLDADTWSTYTAGGAEPLQPEKPLENLSARLSQRGLITGQFTYPVCANAPNPTGRLIVAKASLWPGLDFPLLTHAASAASFPFDSTADQFFDADQYLAYTELGHRLGDAVVEALHRAP